jgi:protein TonB
VLVLPSGAVIRLASTVAPGQLLFLTNDRTRKEVVCQVVKSKNYHRSASGYVELEFTEPVIGFWGMRFSGDRNAVSPSPRPQVAAPVQAAKLDVPPGVRAKVEEIKAPVAMQAQPIAIVKSSVPANLDDLSALTEIFKTEIKTDARSANRADILAPAETSSESLKLEANRLQEQLSALLFTEQKQNQGSAPVSAAPISKQELAEAAAKIFEIADSAPGKPQPVAPVSSAPKSAIAPVKSSFEDDEVKVPAWLEPLARNAAIPAPLDESVDLTPWSAPVSSEAAPTPKSSSAAVKHASTTAPMFGNSLLGDSGVDVPKSGGSKKGIWLGMLAAGVALAAVGGYWYQQQYGNPIHFASGAGSSAIAPPPAVTPAVTSSSVVPANPVSTAPAPPANSASEDSSSSGKSRASAPVANSAPSVQSQGQGKVQPASISERIVKPNVNLDAGKAPVNSAASIAPEIKKPSLGKVRLAKPKVGRAVLGQNSDEIEPAMEVSGEQLGSSANTFGDNLLAGSSKQPSAPAALPIGGDVKPARLVSSIPPAYPALAKAQHVGGDVRIDALIDANGRVTTMKVMSGPTLLHQAAMDSLRQWKYRAATLDGNPVPMHLTVTIQFRLQ